MFLGDIFDLLRTTAWQSVADGAKPWGAAPVNASIGTTAQQVLQATISQPDNAAILSFLRSWQPSNGATVERFYVPGNHDRLCNDRSACQQLVVQALGLAAPGGGVFPNYYSDPAYQVFARHGHEWDWANFEQSGDIDLRKGWQINPQWYGQVPIGDPITAEFCAKLPSAVDAALAGVAGLAPGVRQKIVAQFQKVFEVRPLGAIIPWLFATLDRVRAQGAAPAALAAVQTAIQSVAVQFEAMPFVKNWLKANGTFSPVDHADMIQALMWALRTFKLESIQHILPMVDRFMPLWENDNHSPNAVVDFEALKKDQTGLGFNPLYLLYGHTHTPGQVPIDYDAANDRTRVYLNTGTWAGGHWQTRQKNGFTTWKGLTYTILYSPQIDPDSRAGAPYLGYPTFETWTGSLLE